MITAAITNEYASAARRMHTHAEQLFDEAQRGTDVRLGTADHLYGLAAECALKAILLARGVLPRPPAFPADKKIKAAYSKHINELWDEYVAWASGIAAYQIPTTSNFIQWSAHDRYLHDNFFLPPRVKDHRDGSLLTAALLEQAIIDGVVQ